METNVFETASRSKLRFETNRGSLPVEDLWDLNLQSLDNIARAVNKNLKASQEESFIVKRSNADTELELKLEILKHIIKSKQDEAEARLETHKKNQEIALLKELKANKSMEKLQSMTPEEIDARLAELEA